MDITLLLGFVLATLTLALMPGPDNIYVLTESVAKGWRQGIGITTGLISGIVVHTTVVATGFSLVIYQYDWTYDVMKYLGSAYLLNMAYGAYKEKPMEISIGEEHHRDAFWKLFRIGFLMNVLNPKVTLFFMVLLPQFVSNDPEHWSPMWQMVALGLTFMMVSYPVFATVAIVAGKLTTTLRNDRFWLYTKWVKVIVLLILAVLLVVSEK